MAKKEEPVEVKDTSGGNGALVWIIGGLVAVAIIVVVVLLAN